MFKVQKRDGMLEDFDRSKIAGGVVKAGGSDTDGEKVAAEVDAWLPTKAVNGVVNVTDLREKVLEVLREVNAVAADAFEAYQKPTA